MSGPADREAAVAKLGMWLFLSTELVLFGGLFLLYAVYLDRYPHEFASAGREMNVIFGTANTVILLTSSLLAAMALTAIQRDKRRISVLCLGGTLFCALFFLCNKYFEWSAEIGHGNYPNSPQLTAGPLGKSVFFSLYYMTVGLHGLHVLIGSVLLAVVAVRVQRRTLHAGNYIVLENSALYWHLVDLVWIFIFPLYYLLL
jgi:cytochrome c oxidase subunit III